MSDILSELKFDLAQPDEYAFVFDSWARSFQKSRWAGCTPNHLYASVSRQGSAEIVDRGAKVLVAYVDIPGGRRVVGYSVSEPERNILHWLFVKRDYRVPGLQIGTALLNETVRDFGPGRRFYTYRTDASLPFLGPSWKHEPKLARVRG